MCRYRSCSRILKSRLLEINEYEYKQQPHACIASLSTGVKAAFNVTMNVAEKNNMRYQNFNIVYRIRLLWQSCWSDYTNLWYAYADTYLSSLVLSYASPPLYLLIATFTMGWRNSMIRWQKGVSMPWLIWIKFLHSEMCNPVVL